MSVFGQLWVERNYGATAGLQIALGSHINRVGLSIKAYYFEGNIQLNLNVSGYRNFTNIGAPGSSSELKITTGVLTSFGRKIDSRQNELLSSVSNQTEYESAVGYAYIWYIDNHQTSQRSGIIGLHIQDYSVVTENDILAGQGQDRFRTGGITLSYTYEDWVFGITYMGWTGDPKSSGVKKYPNSTYPSKTGYKDIRDGTLGRFSNGITALQAESFTDYGQVYRFQAGLDSEQARNVMQNKFIHEWMTNGYHYPMLTPEGDPYLFEEEQQIRPSRIYLEGMLNPTLFY